MRRFLSLALALLATASPVLSQEAEETWPDAFCREYRGTIGDKLKITMQLVCEPADSMRGGDFEFRGHYWYDNKKIPIQLWGGDDGWRALKLDEQVYAGTKRGHEHTGTFQGKLNDNGTISGNWTDGAGKKTLPFNLTPASAEGAAKMELVALESSWRERTKGGVASLENTASVLQVSGVPGARRINQTLLEDAVTNFSDIEEDETVDKTADSPPQKKKPVAKPALTVESVSKVMLARKKEEMIENHEKWSFGYMSGVRLNQQGLLSTEHISSDYTGGAHPNSLTSFRTFDTKTGEALELGKLLQPAFFKALPKIASDKLKEVEGLAENEAIGPDAGLSISPEEYEEDALNWFLTPQGLVIHFNPYQVAAYARGNVQFTVPYAELRPYLAEKSALGQMVGE